MPKAIVVHQTGGPEELRYEDVPDPAPGPGEARVRQTAIGVNFIDVYFRQGIYKVPAMPFVPGQEGAGVVEAVGPGVTEVAVGDRVVYAGLMGAYAETRLAPATRLLKPPQQIDDRAAAAVIFKGLTAEYLLLRCARVGRGDTILFHAAAGGVGSVACQWAKHLGLRVIGTAGGPEKVARARAFGCDDVIDYDKEDVTARVKEMTGGRGVNAVFDGVGARTFEASLASLATRGMLVLFGAASGLVPPVDPTQLARGSFYLTRPSLFHYIASRDELTTAAGRVFEVVASGTVKIDVGQSYALRDAARAHTDLEARKTVGSTLLLP
jgi:NADPH2:quinone reductase